MKILWIKADFLHPTTKGGHIRTLEILRRLHQRHEVHYVGLTASGQEEGPRRSGEYSTFSHAIVHEPPRKDSAAFVAQLAAGLFSHVPVAISRYRSEAMARKIEELRASQRFDQVVCDFLTPAINIGDLSGCVLFQHNVETAIWRRHAEHAPDPFRKFYFGIQARRMFDYERKSCLAARHVIAVSRADAELMKEWFGAQRVSVVPTGVDIEYFRRPLSSDAVADVIFVGSMDWLPNVDGIQYFVREILPLIRRKRPGCTVAVVGRSPLKQIVELSEKDSGIRVTGTVPDIRPYLWGSAVSIVPLRIGGGTRLKIYESMAAGTPVVSTSVGAEGLDVSSPGNIRLADSPEAFAENCLALLDDAAERARTSEEAWEHVNARFSWDRVVECFEKVLESAS
ncbi:MAG: glycosyltransferase family 4 protein [Bryobacteraceae bacterium]